MGDRGYATRTLARSERGKRTGADRQGCAGHHVGGSGSHDHRMGLDEPIVVGLSLFPGQAVPYLMELRSGTPFSKSGDQTAWPRDRERTGSKRAFAS
jgi:hypothetical protein